MCFDGCWAVVQELRTGRFGEREERREGRKDEMMVSGELASLCFAVFSPSRLDRLTQRRRLRTLVWSSLGEAHFVGINVLFVVPGRDGIRAGRRGQSRSHQEDEKRVGELQTLYSKEVVRRGKAVCVSSVNIGERKVRPGRHIGPSVTPERRGKISSGECEWKKTLHASPRVSER
jgi:hypothetical protein